MNQRNKTHQHGPRDLSIQYGRFKKGKLKIEFGVCEKQFEQFL